MWRLPQCEIAVTKLERKGRRRGGRAPGNGSKTPIESDAVCLDGESACESHFGNGRTWRIVFSGLQAVRGGLGKRFATVIHYHLDGHVLATRDAQFGPNFVTIQPLGVCVCSF